MHYSGQGGRRGQDIRIGHGPGNRRVSSKERGSTLKRHHIELEEPIKQLGVYTVTVVLYKDVSAKLKVWVVKEEQK